MSTFGEMQTEISEDLDRPNWLATGRISREIKRAIDFHAAERFWFNDARTYTFTTTLDDDTYSVVASAPIEDFITIQMVEIQIGGQYRYLHRMDADDMAFSKQTTASSGQPHSWSYYGNEIQLYPTPNDAYTLRIHGHVKLTPLENDTDENAWTTSAEQLIIAAAKKRLMARIAKDPQQAQMAEADEMRELQRLREETSRRTATGCIRSWF